MTTVFNLDKQRYSGRIPGFQKWYRRTQSASNRVLKIICNFMLRVSGAWRHIELSEKAQIGAGLYFGHAYGITINPNSKIGKNVNIHKGVTIGQENRGKRKGTPIIGDMVWIGVNATIVGAVTIGSDVLIAPNAYVNCDVPDHSIVVGNPCIIKHCISATEGYINRAM